MKNSSESPPPVQTVLFATPTSGIPIKVTRQDTWEWPQIKGLLDDASLSTTNSKTTDSNTEMRGFMGTLYSLLPDGKANLREIRDNAKRYFRSADRGRPEAKAVLKPYKRQLRSLVWAVRQKLAVIFCMPNQRNWDKRAFALFTDLQMHLGRLPRAYFLTLTFAGTVTYKSVRKRLGSLTRNSLYREGFESVDVVAFHSERNEGRLHVHLMIWSKQCRSLSDEKAALERCKEGMTRPRSGIGITDCQRVSGAEEFIRTAAYMAWNYHQTISLPKGPNNPIPKGARVLSVPKEVQPGTKWARTGKFSFVTPATTAWRRAVAKYAESKGRHPDCDRRWIWRERRKIREYLEPVGWWNVCVTGLDGHTYRVIAAEEDCEGNETYLVSSDRRGSFYLTETGLKELAKLEVWPGCLPKNDRLDLTTGKLAYWYEVFGMHAFMRHEALDSNQLTPCPTGDNDDNSLLLRQRWYQRHDGKPPQQNSLPMRKIAILSDIHGNLPALEAVLRDVEQCGAGSIVFLGDIVGYGASPAECVALVRKLGGHCVMGNHDEAIMTVRQPGFQFADPNWRRCRYLAPLAHAAVELDAEQAAWLAELPYTTLLPGAIAAHASLYQPQAFPFISDAASALCTLELLREREDKVGFFGHTHAAGIFSDRDDLLDWLDDDRVKIPACLACVVTVGAVGQQSHPTDRRACWVLWNPDERVVEFRKTAYNRHQAEMDMM